MDVARILRNIDDMVDVEFEDSAMLIELKDFIHQQQNLIESLKNCGNCGSQDGYDCRACERYEDNDSTYKNVTVNDQWQPIKQDLS